MLVRDRDEARRVFLRAWRKHGAGEPLEPLEAVIVGVIERHPDYHALLADHDAALGAEFSPHAGVENPFLHMGMHVAIHEQLATDRPAGVRALYRRALARFPDPHALEHRMMDCLGETLWRARRDGTPPDAGAYLECLRRLLNRDERR